MSVKSAVVPRAAAVLTSRRLRNLRRGWASLKRRVRFRPHEVDVFLRIGDPYSHVLVQALPSFTKRFRVDLKLHAVAELPEEMTPDRLRLEGWAQRDATELANLYQLSPPGLPRSAQDIHAASLSLADALSRNLVEVADVFDQFASDKDAAVVDDQSAAIKTLRAGERALAKGHYMSAMLHYGGEWYWGIDRLNHLETRLIDEGLAHSENESPFYERRLRFLNEPAPTLDGAIPLTLYWSARSPYSYIVLERAIELARAFGVALDVRPVLPMVMRNLLVPRTKRFYILLDSSREAQLLKIPFGRVCDPLGAGVERCYAVFDLARQTGNELAWAREFSTAVWSEGIDASTDAGIAEIAKRAGLDPKQCVAAAANTDWKAWAELHRTEMLAGGFWGVPTLRFGDTWVWGQDRFWIIEDAMRAASED